MKRYSIFMCLCLVASALTASGIKFDRPFSPLEGMVAVEEQPFRQEICLNGLWQFQPLEVSNGWKSGTGVPPVLPLPRVEGWESTPIKIPSPWNVNAVCHDASGGGMDARSYPSYPESWNHVKMGWLRKSVTISNDWEGQRIFLHLEAVAGDCTVLVNGKEMGSHFDVSLLGEFDITDAVKWGSANEILLGIRDHKFYAEKGPFGNLTYPSGSFWLMDAIGVWQDVVLLAKPPVRVADIFMQSHLEKDQLVAEIELINDTAKPQTVQVDLPIFEWINHEDLSRENVLTAPEISWSLGDEALRLRSEEIVLKAGETRTVTLQAGVNGRLKKWNVWNRGTPDLYMASAQVRLNGVPVDKKMQRFGWREVKLVDGDLLLNGEPVKLMHDGWHFTGVANMSRRYVWSWYTLAKDANVNFVRPHAMPYPRYFYDMADEMGMLLMDENGIFGSHVDFNYDSPQFWERNQEHIKSLVRRDRNHPSIVGWSVANEIWCVLRARASAEKQEEVYDKIFDLCKLARSMDPTRQWVQSDGDKDLNGRLDVWTIHTGGSHSDVIPPNKLWGVSEGGSSYYGKPGHYKPFVGDRAFRSFDDRLDALAIEDYNLIRTLREQDADIYNVWNLVWHGMKPLPIGLKDVSKKQMELTDGIFFGDYIEGQPGVQPERIAPFSTTVNPGYDPSLPLYEPNALYLAMQAAMHPDGAQPCEWDHFEPSAQLPAAPAVVDPAKQVAFSGNPTGVIHDNLESIGVPFGTSSTFMIIDVSSIERAHLAPTKKKAGQVVSNGGTVLLVGLSPATQDTANRILPLSVICTDDAASSLLPNRKDPRTACFSFEELYFAESYMNKTIAKYSIGGAFVENATVLLMRNNTEWKRWLTGAEYSKTISIVRSELENEQNPVLAELKQGDGAYLVSTLEMEKIGDEHVELYRKLFTNLAVELTAQKELSVPAFEGTVLVNALTLGRLGADSVEAAIAEDYIGEASMNPKENDAGWAVASNAGDRFVFSHLKQSESEDIYTVYFSYWVYSPIDLGDLLNAGPDLPQVTQFCFISDQARVYLNGQLLEPARSESVDYRTRLTFEKVPLKQGWNRFLVKVASDSLMNADPGTLAVRMFSTNASYDRLLKSAIQIEQ